MKIGVIGCGQQAPKHIRGLLAGARAPGVDIVVTDLERTAAETVARQFEGVQVAPSVDAILGASAVTGVILCVPTPAHAPLIRAAVEAGKDYLVEKPFCETADEAAALADLTRANGRVGMIGCIYRYAPTLERVATALVGARETGVSPALGRVSNAVLRIGGRGSRQLWKHDRARGGGAINEMLVHMLDLALWYFGEAETLELTQVGLQRPERSIQGARHIVDAEDHVTVRYRSKSGVEAVIQADLLTPSFMQSVEVSGENGNLIASVTPQVASKLYLAEARGGFETGWTDIDQPGDFYAGQARAFLDAIKRRDIPATGALDDALAMMDMVSRLRRSLIEKTEAATA